MPSNPRTGAHNGARIMTGMAALLSAFTPIWTLTAIGYAVGRSGLLGDRAEPVLGRFVFHVAMPSALFAMVSGAR